MAWETYNKGKSDQGERLIVVVPHKTRGQEWLQIYPQHAPNNWAQPGDVNGWNGNREAPTFNPSIDCSKRDDGGWHGYIIGGVICGVDKKPINLEK